MGFIRRILHGGKQQTAPGSRASKLLAGPHSCHFETLEPRQLLAADIHFGSVYFEEATGDDSAPDRFVVTFEGGAEGTTLNRIIIDGDKARNGELSMGDTFFDTQPGGLGAFNSVDIDIETPAGFSIVNVDVADGGMLLVIDLEGFTAGDKLVFTVDVDEMGFFAPTALVEGGEFEGARITGEFTAPHYEAAEIETTYFDFFDSQFAASSASAGSTLDLPSDTWAPTGQGDFSDRTAGAVGSTPQTPLPITVAGTVFVDQNLNNQQDLGDDGIAGVSLTLLRKEGNSYVSTGLTATTDADGHYKFEDPSILPGTYRVVETQPDGYYSVGADAGRVGTEDRGTVLTSDIVSEIELRGGEDSVENDFAEALPGSLGGYVYHDRDNDGQREAGEEGIGGVTIRVVPVTTIDGNGLTPIEVSTDSDGKWFVDGLRPGQYRVVEVNQPAPYHDGLDTPGSLGGSAVNPGDELNDIQLLSGQDGVEYNFGEILPGSISGRVHANTDGNCELNAGDILLEGVQIDLLDADGKVIQTTYTDANGLYQFTDLPIGTYGVFEHQPNAYLDGGDHVGSAGGVVSANDLINAIVIGPGVEAVDYNFCEHTPLTLSGHVYHDRDNDGARETGEEGIAGATLTLYDAAGNVVASTSSAGADGYYEFTGLPPGEYSIVETQPASWLDGKDAAGNLGGAAENPGDRIRQIVMEFGDTGVDYDFGEVAPSSISGRVHADVDGDCEWDPGETLLSGVQIDLRDAAGNVIATQYTDDNGEYVFDGLPPGVYSVFEHQPTGYFDGGDKIGSVGGVKAANDLIAEIALRSGTIAVDYNFCEHVPLTISGHVYHDRDDNGVRETGEEGIAGVTLRLIDADGNQVAATTSGGADGYYEFTGLDRGTYTIVEVQPVGWLDGLDAAGNLGGVADNPGDAIRQVTIEYGETGVDYDFGELLPGSISGRVHADENGNCEYDPGELPLSGVVVDLLDVDGNVIATTTTDENGEYRFDNLRPGEYGVREHQPAGYFDGGESVGTGGGIVADDLFTQIAVFSGDHLVDYDFCEKPPAAISGHVFQDGATLLTDDGEVPANIHELRDGLRTADDTPLAGVTLELRHGVTGEPLLGDIALPGMYPSGEPIRVVTDANGYYEFAGLPAGNYAVFQIHPDGFIDSRDTPGTNGGVAVNPTDTISPLVLATLTVDPADDAILRVAVFPGEHAQENNFSEIRVSQLPPPETPDPDPDPPVRIPFEPALRPVTAPIIVTPQHLTPPSITGSDGTSWYTWHLSVVNGGYPRGLNVSTQPLITAASAEISAFTVEKLRKGHWEVTDREGNRVELEFGAEGATPIAGDFNGDGVTEVGVYLDGEWFIDVNGNGHWDPEDLWAKLGTADDRPVVGDWDGDGKDDIGIFGPAWSGDPTAIRFEPGQPSSANPSKEIAKNLPPELEKAAMGNRELKLSSVGSLREDLIDHVFAFGTPTDSPLVGDFNGDGIDTIAIFQDGQWHIDIDGDGKFTEADLAFSFGQKGDIPLAGDFTGNGVSNVGVYRDGTFILDTNNNRQIDAQDAVFEMEGGEDAKPIVGDFNGDGIHTPGTYRDAS